MRRKYRFIHLILAFALGSLMFSSVTLATVNQNRGDETGQITATFINQKGEPIGHAFLTEGKTGVRILVKVSGIAPGKHGFHVHEKAFEGKDFSTAGAHFNPTAKEHGFYNPKGYHVGDMINLEVTKEGRAHMEFFIEGVNLKKDDPLSLRGKSLIIHEKEDDYVTDPAGNSGDRIAGANIPM